MPVVDLSGASLAALLQALAALGRTDPGQIDPHRVLDEVSGWLQGPVPHDRLVVALLDEGGRTFRIFGEHAAGGLTLHTAHYTTDLDPRARYVVADWGAVRDGFTGRSMLIDDFRADPRFDRKGPFEQEIHDAGLRSAVLVPLRSGDCVIGQLVATSRQVGLFGETHLAMSEKVAELLGPVVENVDLRRRECRRRDRIAALKAVTRALGSSLNIQDVFDRLADAVRPVVDFDVVGVCLISESGREVEVLAEVNTEDRVGAPWRMAIDDFSFAARIRAGEPMVIHDACVELDPARPGDRLMLDDGGRAAVSAPLWFGDTAGGAVYFGKRQPYWYDASDVEIAQAIAAQVVLALQHQRLAEEQRRLASVEGRARRLQDRVRDLRSELGQRYGFDQIIGRSPALREALLAADKVARTETTVLITGESGTGKELVARAIHHASFRAESPFVALNCAALPEALLESELFGHERGAFTGADRQKPGRFELAAGGTLFLDEVGELSPAVQVKLLRVLQERQYERVGGTQTLSADVRLVAATNRDLEAAVETGQFRADLYYRFNVFRVHLPALRERRDDVLLLADHFVRTLGERMGRGDPGLSRDARDALLAHPWPGNIRELQNAVERALIVSDGGLLTAAQLGLVTRRTRPTPPAGERPATARALAEWEQQMVRDALASAGGNKSRAAEMLGLTRSQLYTRLKRHK
jgi:transcriptional regulator with GAF, ATPase, and Fis domain